MRVPSVKEREVILGFPVDCTRRCLEGSTAHNNDCRLNLLGNSWSIPVVAYLLYCLFRTLGLLPKLDLVTLVERLTPGREQFLSSLLMRPAVRQTTKAGSVQQGLVSRLMGQVSVKGEDILLQLGSDLPARYHRLRASIPSKLWRWKDVAGWRWTDALELRAVKTAIVWRLKELEEKECRFLRLVDSLVVLRALSRGRSSSRRLRRTLCRIGALQLAGGLVGIWGYVDTHQNPADRPSRRPLRKKLVKRPRK